MVVETLAALPVHKSSEMRSLLPYVNEVSHTEHCALSSLLYIKETKL